MGNELVCIATGIDVRAVYRRHNQEAVLQNWVDRALLTTDSIRRWEVITPRLVELLELLTPVERTDIKRWWVGSKGDLVRAARDLFLAPFCRPTMPEPFIVIGPPLFPIDVRVDDIPVFSREDLARLFESVGTPQLRRISGAMRMGYPYLLWVRDYDTRSSVRLLHNEGFVT